MALTTTRFRRAAATALALAALLLAGPARADDADAKAVLDKVKAGDGLAKVKEKLAADPVGSRFRVDAFDLTAEKALKVTGVMLVPGAEDKDRDQAERDTRAKVIAAVQEVAGAKDFKEFEFDVKAVRGEKLPHIALQAAAVAAGEKEPAADELKLTGAAFDAKGRLVITGLRGNNPKTEDWLTTTGKMVVAKSFVAPTPDEKLPTIVFDVRPPEKGTDWPLSPAAIQKSLAAANSPGLSRIRVERAYLISAPAKADESNPAGVAWSYALSGIVIGTQPVPKEDVDRITKQVMPAAFAAAKWPAITTGDLEKLTLADNRVPDPGPLFQKSVAAHPDLDGVRLEARTEFGPEGKLVLVGLQPGLSEKGTEELTAVVRAALDAAATGSDGHPLYRRLGDRGVSTTKLERVRIRELHSELRRWASENLDETRLARLYYDESGTLTVTCDSPNPANDALVKAELKKRAAALGVPVAAAGATPPPPVKEPKDEPKAEPKKEPKKDVKEEPKKDAKEEPKKEEPKKEEPKKEEKDGVSASRLAPARLAARRADDPKQPAAGADPRVKPSAAPIKRSLTAFLQTETTDPKNEKRWKAVLIERGYFDEQDRFTVRGVVNSDAQKKDFAAYLDTLAKDPEWASYFTPAGRAEPDLEVIPMGKLVERVQRVTPAYSVFDGIRVNDAKYVFEKDYRGTTGPTLVFVAHLVGRTDRDAPAALQRLISEDADYFARRLPKGRLLRFEKDPDAVPSDDQLGDFSVGYGAAALSKGELVKAKEWLDRGLLHHPHEAAVWFLSAYYHHLLGDDELVRRDLYRMIELEGRLAFDGPVQRKRRYLAAKDLQGERRDELEKIWLAYWKDVKDGAQPMKFATGK